ncbi:short chain dehydrogenase reductase family [Colletotrichum truncatum]|uniref:Short chain dehydrogenase reductase family n=1 Tax=Colletotrichum truncatum TaxID=5467 RepID=A0ACC3ZCT5_COLTU|nr:short chain dehydrogenase reductase family [Colletotrichum truncatum]KAF6797896.1 short chain dehydrogenase reductase family [Colletotrichum truncatum]
MPTTLECGLSLRPSVELRTLDELRLIRWRVQSSCTREFGRNAQRNSSTIKQTHRPCRKLSTTAIKLQNKHKMAPKYINKLEGKSVLVVGGTSGIGFAVAEASVEYGAHVVVASRSQENIDNAIKRLKTSYPDAADRIRGHTVDLHSDDNETSITQLFDFATYGGKNLLDHVVETAGEALNGSLLLQEATPYNISEVNKTRFVGAIILAKVADTYLKREHTSSFTMTSGVASHKPWAGWSVRAAVLGAKEALTKGLAVDMKPVRVNIVSPGSVKTELFDHAIKSLGDDQEKAMQMFSGGTLLNRIGTPEDLAEAYLSLMKNYFITGTTIHVEGGQLLK